MSGGLQFERELAGAEGAKCATCGREQVAKMDAIGRIRYRCRVCDGVSPLRPRQPDETPNSQALVPASRAVTALPPVKAGQLRCQHCANGLESTSGRFCSAACLKAVHDARKRKPCRGCARLFTPTVQHKSHCTWCVEKARTPKMRLCTGCNRITRHERGMLVVASCKECRREKRHGRVCKWALKACACGATFQPTGPAAKWCERCAPLQHEKWMTTRNIARRRQSA